MPLIEGLYGEWRTGSLLMYGIIDGCLSRDIARLFLRDEMLKLVEFMDLSILIQEYTSMGPGFVGKVVLTVGSRDDQAYPCV